VSKPTHLLQLRKDSLLFNDYDVGQRLEPKFSLSSSVLQKCGKLEVLYRLRGSEPSSSYKTLRRRYNAKLKS
jgi:hypothetical protein